MAELGWLADVLGFANLMSTAPELAGEIDTCEYLIPSRALGAKGELPASLS